MSHLWNKSPHSWNKSPYGINLLDERNFQKLIRKNNLLDERNFQKLNQKKHLTLEFVLSESFNEDQHDVATFYSPEEMFYNQVYVDHGW